jgi:hypothetical protein
MGSLKEPIDAPAGAAELDPAASGQQIADASLSVDSEMALAASVASAEPPRLYLPACGALCDILWWTRSRS